MASGTCDTRERFTHTNHTFITKVAVFLGKVVINLLLMIAWFNSVEIVHQTINLTGEASRNNSQNQ